MSRSQMTYRYIYFYREWMILRRNGSSWRILRSYCKNYSFFSLFWTVYIISGIYKRYSIMLFNNLNPFSTLNNEIFFQKSMDWSNQINHGSRSRGAETRSSERLLSISRQTSKGNTIFHCERERERERERESNFWRERVINEICHFVNFMYTRI